MVRQWETERYVQFIIDAIQNQLRLQVLTFYEELRSTSKHEEAENVSEIWNF